MNAHTTDDESSCDSICRPALIRRDSAPVATRQTESRLRLRRWPPRWKQRAQEEVILCILNTISVFVYPPAAAEISRLPGSKLRFPVRREFLEFPFHRQRILDRERVVIESLARHVHHAWSAI